MMTFEPQVTDRRHHVDVSLDTRQGILNGEMADSRTWVKGRPGPRYSLDGFPATDM